MSITDSLISLAVEDIPNSYSKEDKEVLPTLYLFFDSNIETVDTSIIRQGSISVEVPSPDPDTLPPTQICFACDVLSSSTLREGQHALALEIPDYLFLSELRTNALFNQLIPSIVNKLRPIGISILTSTLKEPTDPDEIAALEEGLIEFDDLPDTRPLLEVMTCSRYESNSALYFAYDRDRKGDINLSTKVEVKDYISPSYEQELESIKAILITL